MKTIDQLAAEHGFFEGLPDAVTALVAGCGSNVAVPAGDYVLREGAPADRFFLIRHGSVALEFYRPGSGPQTFMTLGAGDVLGVSWLVEPYVWHHDGRAVEPLRAVAFDAQCLRAKCDAEPAIGYALMRRFVPALVDRMHAARLQALDVYGAPT
ncbi:MAG: cyclic nucleotide-binding domain-containing protein [Pseudomonadota bacterium]